MIANLTTTGLIDAHSHLRATSLASQGVSAAGGLEEALLRFTGMSSVDPRDDAFVACSELLLAGFTGVQAMFHTFLEAERYLETLRQVATGVRDSGIRAVIILGVTDRNEFLPAGVSDGLLLPSWLPPEANCAAEDLEWVLSRASEEFPEISFGIGPVGAQWCSDGSLEILGALASRGLRVHSHLLESRFQRRWLDEEPIARLQRHGLLGELTSLAHGVWCEEADLKAIAQSGAQLVFCPGSNAVLRAGTANPGEWLSNGVRFGFGLDSSTSATEAIRAANSVVDNFPALEVLTAGGAAATGLACHEDSVSWHDFAQGQVVDVIVRGKTLVAGGRLVEQTNLEAAKERIAEAMLRDKANRDARIATLDGLMPRYLAAIESCCG